MQLRLLIPFLACPWLAAQPPHSEVRDIIFEVVDLAKDGRKIPGWGSPQDRAAHLLARAGYVAEAEDIVKRYLPANEMPPYYLWKAWAVYGQSQRVDSYLASLRNPSDKVGVLNVYANLLWRLGDKQKAKQTYLAAQALLPRVTDPAKRTGARNVLTQGLRFVDDDAPIAISTKTIPLPGRPPTPSLSSRFPITPNSFTLQTPTDREASSAFDEKAINEIYSNLRSGNTEALHRIVAASASPFQKALALASVQHIMNQWNLGDYSEICAQAIPTPGSDSKLAKAEALGSTATIIAASGTKNRARALLINAADLAASVPGLPIPRIQVLSILAMRQASAGFEPDARATFTRANEIASSFPFAPVVWNQRKQSKYRDDAIGPLIGDAVQFDRLALADQIVSANPDPTYAAVSSLVSALLGVNDYSRALSTARSIPDPAYRAKELLWIAGRWLDDIRAPNF